MVRWLPEPPVEYSDQQVRLALIRIALGDDALFSAAFLNALAQLA